MEQHKIDRINFLSKKHKTEGLTTEEAAERAALHREYVEEIKESLRAHLDNTYLMDEKGNKTKLRRKEGK